MPRGHTFENGADFFAKLNAEETRGAAHGITKDLDSFLSTYLNVGIQGSELAKAINIINDMLTWRLADQPDHDPEDLQFFDKRRTKIFLGYSSSVATSGNREIIRYLVEHRMIDSLVTTAGAVEDDIMRCFGDYISTSFKGNDDVNLIS